MDGEFTYITQPEGSNNLGVWELVHSGSVYRISVEADETVTFAALVDETVQWKYRLEFAPAVGVTISDVLSTGSSSVNWNYEGSFNCGGELTGSLYMEKAKLCFRFRVMNPL